MDGAGDAKYALRLQASDRNWSFGPELTLASDDRNSWVFWCPVIFVSIAMRGDTQHDELSEGLATLVMLRCDADGVRTSSRICPVRTPSIELIWQEYRPNP
jgi:hypothetical protein